MTSNLINVSNVLVENVIVVNLMIRFYLRLTRRWCSGRSPLPNDVAESPFCSQEEGKRLRGRQRYGTPQNRQTICAKRLYGGPIYSGPCAHESA